MLQDPSLLERARKLLHEEWRAGVGDAAPGLTERDCPAFWLLPQFVAMIAESCDRSALQLEPTIKRMIVEHTFHDLCADHTTEIDPQELGTKAIDRQVRTVVRVLERVRRTALAQGEWSGTPVTPQMFG